MPVFKISCGSWARLSRNFNGGNMRQYLVPAVLWDGATFF